MINAAAMGRVLFGDPEVRSGRATKGGKQMDEASFLGLN